LYETEDAIKALEKRQKRQKKRLERKLAEAMKNPNADIQKIKN
jgi:hypothetical protein